MSTGAASGASGAGVLAVLVVYLLAVLVFEVAFWRVLSKAGRPGWGAIIPIYTAYLLCKVAGKPGWWTILLFVPFVNIVLTVLVWHGVSRGFGHGAGFTVGLVLLPFLFVPILGFGQSQYRGPAPSYPV